MSITLTHPNGRQVTVPDGVAESYISQGWVVPGSSTPVESDGKDTPQKRTKAMKGAIRARPHVDEDGSVPAADDGGSEV